MKRTLYLETFLISLAVLVLEVSYTRVFSFKLVYYFTYVIIGIALLGLGAGGVLVSASDRLRRTSAEDLILKCCGAAGIAVLAGYLVIALTPLRLFDIVISGMDKPGLVATESVKLLIVLAALFVPFLSGGIALATIFSRDAERIGRLYGADLLGAALGCVLVIPALTTLSPPGAVYAAGAAFALAGIRLARDADGPWRAGIPALTLALAAGAIFAPYLPDPVRDPVKGGDEVAPIFSQWSPVFRVDVVPIPGTKDPEIRFLVHDGTLGSSISEFDGDVNSLTRYDDSDRAFPFRILPPEPKVAIIGSAGGNEVLASLRLGASHITGIELNPVTVSLLREHFLDFTGRIAEHPKVTIVNSEGRSYLKQSGEQFDLIWLVAPDSYAAMNAATSGAFVLSESYLYTQEMIAEALERLSPGGILCAQFGEIDFDIKPNRVIRYLGTAREAFRDRGIEDFERHALVSVAPGFGRLNSSSILLQKSPFQPSHVEAFKTAVSKVDGGRVIYEGPDASEDGLIRKAIELDGVERDAFYSNYPYDVLPITDDSPFFWHFVRFSDLFGSDKEFSHFNVEEGIGERVQLTLLAFALAFAAIFLVVPVVVLREAWLAVPRKGLVAVYFGCLGLGFMFIEVAMIQKLTLLLGYPTYSLTVTLFAILLSTGVGSLVSERFRDDPLPLLQRTGAALAGLIVLYYFALGPVVDASVGASFSARVALTIAILTPLGLCLGMFMPIGLGIASGLGTRGEQIVAWCWAVNGFFSVAGSILSTMLSMGLGFSGVMLVGLLIYGLAVAAMTSVLRADPVYGS